jgi:hypothetical protein
MHVHAGISFLRVRREKVAGMVNASGPGCKAKEKLREQRWAGKENAGESLLRSGRTIIIFGEKQSGLKQRKLS